MIDRNGSNLIVWEEPGGDRLLVERRDDVYSGAEEVFDIEISNELQEDDEAVAANSDVKVGCESGTQEITIFLQISGSPPYILRRNGEEIESGLSPGDFPYVDSPPNGGDVTYEIEDFESDTDETTCSIPFIRKAFLSGSEPDPEKGSSGVEEGQFETKTGDLWFTGFSVEDRFETESVEVNVNQPSPGDDGDIWLQLESAGQNDSFEIEEIIFEDRPPLDVEEDDKDIWTSLIDYD